MAAQVLKAGYAGLIVLCAIAVGFATGCGEDNETGAIPNVNRLVGYWGTIERRVDGVSVYQSDGTDFYWVIYDDDLVCLIEKLPSGEYQMDSTFPYQVEGNQFAARFDLSEVYLPEPPIYMRYHLSADIDTLTFDWEDADSGTALEIVMVRQVSIPDCGCDAIP